MSDHKHQYELKEKKTILQEAKAIDYLKQFVCTVEGCDKVQTVDLRRQKR